MSANREIADYAVKGWYDDFEGFVSPWEQERLRSLFEAALTAKDAELAGEVEKARREENEACSLIAADYDGKGMDPRGYSDQLGDAYLTKMDIADAIRSRLTAQQGEARPDTQKGEG